MGAVVLEPQKKAGLLGVERHHIIDGQQRLTTLQYVFTALCLVLSELDQKAFLPLIENCLVNANPGNHGRQGSGAIQALADLPRP